MTPVLRATVDPTTSAAPAAPLLVLGPSLGTTTAMWADAARLLAPDFRVLRWDLPGHGISPAAPGQFTVAELAEGVVALVDSLGGGRFVHAGVSLGGAVGIELALGPAADRLQGLAVICSAARIGEPGAWRSRAEQVRRQGTASVVAGSSERWFAPSFLTREPERVGRMLNALLDVDDESYSRCCEALADFDRRAHLDRVDVPTVVISGSEDPVVTAADAAATASGIPHATWLEWADTGHQAAAERPERVAEELRRAFAVPARSDAGMRVRREVLSPDYVDAAVAGITPETREFQAFITEYAWGAIWTRPGLDRRMRSAVTISSLVTGHHWQELELHLRAGLRNGLSRAELVEILLQTAVYAGVPAANSAFSVAKRVFADAGEG